MGLSDCDRSQDWQGISLSRASGVSARGDIRGHLGGEKNSIWDPLFGSTHLLLTSRFGRFLLGCSRRYSR